MKINFIIILTLLLAVSSVNALPNHDTNIEVKLSCYSKNVDITRYFYVLNSKNNVTELEPFQNRYVFGIESSLEPKLKQIIDSNNDNYEISFVNLENIKVIDVYFPKQPTQSSSFNKYFIKTKYSSNKFITKQESMSKLDFHYLLIENRTLNELRIVFPKCFFKSVKIKEIYPDPTIRYESENEITLIFDSTKLEEVKGIKGYNPNIIYNYYFKVSQLIIFILSTITGTILIFYSKKIKEWVEKIFKKD